MQMSLTYSRLMSDLTPGYVFFLYTNPHIMVISHIVMIFSHLFTN